MESLICNTTPWESCLWDCSKQSCRYKWRVFRTIHKEQLGDTGSVASLGEVLLIYYLYQKFAKSTVYVWRNEGCKKQGNELGFPSFVCLRFYCVTVLPSSIIHSSTLACQIAIGRGGGLEIWVNLEKTKQKRNILLGGEQLKPAN